MAKVAVALDYLSSIEGSSDIFPSGCLAGFQEVLPCHVLRLHHLDRSFLLPDGVVGTPGKTAGGTRLPGLSLVLLVKWSINVFAFRNCRNTECNINKFHFRTGFSYSPSLVVRNQIHIAVK